MIGKASGRQSELWLAGSLESLVPADHILKRVDRVLDLSWLEGEVRESYSSETGRPSIPPETALRLMLAGYFQGIVHDRKLLREAQVNVAIRWFCGYSIDERLPDHSSLTRIRQRWGGERFGRIFERVVSQCVAAGLVDGETVHCDATLIRADVSWGSLTTDHVEQVLVENAAAQEEADASSGGEKKDDDDPPDGKGDGGAKRSSSQKKKEKKWSRTDPDASMATSRFNQRLEPSYKQHGAVDAKSGVIVDVVVTTGEVNEGTELIDQLERVEANTGKSVTRVTADRGYSSGSNYAALEGRETDPVIPPQPMRSKSRGVPLSRFQYDAKHGLVRCPRGKILRPGSADETGRWYRARARDCAKCDLREQCVAPTARSRSVKIVTGYDALVRARRRWKNRDAWPTEIYTQHRWRVEGVHGVAKTQHGLRRAARRGLDNVAIQVYLTATVMNLKRLAAFVSSVPALRRPAMRLWAVIAAMTACLALTDRPTPIRTYPTNRPPHPTYA